jgi:hypothetical protein
MTLTFTVVGFSVDDQQKNASAKPQNSAHMLMSDAKSTKHEDRCGYAQEE